MNTLSSNALLNYSEKDTAELIRQMFSAEAVEMYLINPNEPSVLTLAATTSKLRDPGRKIRFRPLEGRPGKTAEHAYEYAQNNNNDSPLLLHDEQITSGPHAILGCPDHLQSGKYVSRIVIPVRRRKRLLEGLIVIDNRRQRRDDDEKKGDHYTHFRDLEDLANAKTLKRLIEWNRSAKLFHAILGQMAIWTPKTPVEAMLESVCKLLCLELAADRIDMVGPKDYFDFEVSCLLQFVNPSLALRQGEINKVVNPLQKGDLLPDNSFVGSLLLSDKTLKRCGNVKSLPPEEYHATDSRTQSALAIRLITPGKRKYAINLESVELNYFDEEDEQLLSFILSPIAAKLAEAEGSHAIALYENLIFNNLEEMVFVKDKEGRFVFITQSLSDFLQGSINSNPNEVIGKTDVDFFSAEDAQRFRLKDDQVMRGEASNQRFFERVKPIKSKIECLAHTLKVAIPASKETAMIMARGDIQRAEEIMQQAANSAIVGIMGIFHNVSRDALIQEASGSGTIIWREGDTGEISESIWPLLDCSKTQFGLENLRLDGAFFERLGQLVEKNDLLMLRDIYTQIIIAVNKRSESGRFDPIRLPGDIDPTYDKRIVFKLKNKQKWIELTYVNYYEFGKNENQQCVIIALKDVTQFKTTEITLHELNNALKKQTDRAVLLQESHHRVKNNLFVLQLFANHKAEDIKSEDAKSILNEISDKLNAMLELHKVLSTDSSNSCVDLASYIERIIIPSRTIYGLQHITITFEFKGAPLTCDYDTAEGCGFVISEAITNAAKHAFVGKNGGKIAITLTHIPKEDCQLLIKDDGLGMPSHVTSIVNSDSYGLRLLERTVAGKMGGTISVTTSKQNGTELVITFKPKPL